MVDQILGEPKGEEHSGSESDGMPKLNTRECEKASSGNYGGGGGCFSFGGTVQYIEESNIYLWFVVCRLKRGLVT